MSREIIVRRLAERHLAEAYTWYETQMSGLGADFLNCFEQVLPKISGFPASSPLIYLDYRRALMPRFPFGVFYVVEGELIIVAAVFHLARSPRTIQRDLRP